jgi:transcriptional regulator GlxA family with amidase domain
MQTRNVAILIFDEVEVLDFTGPYEVFAVTHQYDPVKPFNVYLVSQKPGPVAARNGFSVNPHYTIHDCPKPDILLVPGGHGTRTIMHDPEIIDWVRAQNNTTELTLSVCTGALVLATAGVLDGLEATTYHTEIQTLADLVPSLTVRPGERWVDNGRVITSAGVSAGIDMALHVVGKLLGANEADKTAQHMEYEHWQSAVRG